MNRLPSPRAPSRAAFLLRLGVREHGFRVFAFLQDSLARQSRAPKPAYTFDGTASEKVADTRYEFVASLRAAIISPRKTSRSSSSRRDGSRSSRGKENFVRFERTCARCSRARGTYERGGVADLTNRGASFARGQLSRNRQSFSLAFPSVRNRQEGLAEKVCIKIKAVSERRPSLGPGVTNERDGSYSKL